MRTLLAAAIQRFELHVVEQERMVEALRARMNMSQVGRSALKTQVDEAHYLLKVYESVLDGLKKREAQPQPQNQGEHHA
jgi:hypothetical protein